VESRGTHSFERPCIGRRSTRTDRRHRVGARASREWPRGEKRKGSPRVAPPAAGGGKCLSCSLSLFLFPSLPHAWSKCWSSALHSRYARWTTTTIAGDHHHRIATIARHWYRCVRRHQHHQLYQLSHSPSRFIAISWPRRRGSSTDERLSSSILPLSASSLPRRFLHRSVPPLRSRASSPFDRSRRLDRSVSLLLSRLSDESTRYVPRLPRVADREGSSRNLSETDGGRTRI